MPKLTKFKEKEGNNNLRNYIISAIILVGALLSFFIYKSYAAYKVEKKYDVIKARIGEFGMPSCEIVGNPTTYVENATLTIKVTDQGKNGVAEYSWDGKNYSANNTLNITENKDYTGYIKDTKGNVKTCSVTVDKIDGVTPTLTMLSGTYDKNDTNKIATATFGGTGGNVSCKNTSRGNNPVTTINNINALGPNTITCTATGTNGKSVTKTSTITLQHIFTPGDGLMVNNGAEIITTTACITNGSCNAIIMEGKGTQFGPYVSVNKGCYNIIYQGINVHADASTDGNKSAVLYYSAYTWATGISYPILNLTTSQNQTSYYLYFDKNIDGLEFITTNKMALMIVFVEKVWMNYVGPTCP